MSTPRHVGLHHDRVQGLIDPSTRFQDAREEAALAELRDPQREITSLGRQRLGAVPVSFGELTIDAFIATGADRLGCFGLDEFLQNPACDLADQIGALADTNRVEQVRQVRIGQSHRCVLLSEFFQEHTKNHADGSPTGGPHKPHHMTGLNPLGRSSAVGFGSRNGLLAIRKRVRLRVPSGLWAISNAAFESSRGGARS